MAARHLSDQRRERPGAPCAETRGRVQFPSRVRSKALLFIWAAGGCSDVGGAYRAGDLAILKMGGGGGGADLCRANRQTQRGFFGTPFHNGVVGPDCCPVLLIYHGAQANQVGWH